ncbi:CHASE2 domain-containing protein [Phormidium sp. CCY1219]|uniref:CHASE2 domain-containing protein n=1 Tax=Phormidium sp. CCY1219 TaxID=2886104 RepID=UPI002D1F18A2|nr:CHASE2 domain-containing protein [Phormidium sp. CCY1219]MEB3827574.1 CHASE2 domain-containing protein [Phormidium sp. CCY1219]
MMGQIWQQIRPIAERVGQHPTLRAWRGVLFIAPSVTLVTVACSFTGVFHLLEWASLDRFFHLRPPETSDSRIVIVTIDEADINHIGQWPMSDRAMAQVLQHIKAQEPAAIGLDIYRDLPVEPGHAQLVQVFESTPNLIGIQKVGGNGVAPPPILNDLGQVAAADLILDADGKVRRALILIGTGNGEFREGLGAKLALMYLADRGIELESVDEENNSYRLGDAVFVPLTGNEGNYLGADTGGYQILLNFRGGIDKFATISLTDVLENRIPPDLMRDRIVFVGTIAPSLKDSFQTPYDSVVFATPTLTPGVAIHANLTSQILSGALQGRGMLQAANRWVMWGWIALWSAIGAIATKLLLQNYPLQKQECLSSAIAVVAIASFLLVVCGYVSFLGGWLIPVFSPFFALTASAILTANSHNQWQLKRANQQLEMVNEKLEEYSLTLESQVRDRTRELTETLHHLQTTQSQLIQTEKMAALGQLVAGIAHEINNPTSFIYGNVAYAEEYATDLLEILELYQEYYPTPEPEIQDRLEEVEIDYLKEDFPKLLTSMKDGASRIREIVKALRIFSRLDESDLKEVNLHEGLDSTLIIVQNRCQKGDGDAGIQLIKDYGDLPQVCCYARELNQVFMNIVTNAIDAIEQRQKELTAEELQRCPSFIKITTSVIENARVVIAISDNGLGIPPSIKHQLFDPFFTTKPVGKGTGLGLSVARAIVVEKHGGDLRVSSHPGEGTEVRIEIPIQFSASTHQK